MEVGGESTGSFPFDLIEHAPWVLAAIRGQDDSSVDNYLVDPSDGRSDPPSLARVNGSGTYKFHI